MVKGNKMNSVSAEDLLRQVEMQRSLERARIAQKQKLQQNRNLYMKKIGQQMAMSHGIAPQTDAQTKRVLQEKQKRNMQGNERKDSNVAKKLLTAKHVKIIKNYEKKIWVLLYVAAFADALFDILTIPILSTMMSFCTSLYINVGLWNVGEPNKRVRLRLLRASISMIDLVPIINFIPFSILLVYKSHEDEKKRVQRSRKIVKNMV